MRTRLGALALTSAARAQRADLTGIKFCIDPGHGGEDLGAIGRSKLQEKNVTLQIGLKLAQKLKGVGVEAVAGADRVEAALRQLTPFTVLRDARVTVEIGGENRSPFLGVTSQYGCVISLPWNQNVQLYALSGAIVLPCDKWTTSSDRL